MKERKWSWLGFFVWLMMVSLFTCFIMIFPKG